MRRLLNTRVREMSVIALVFSISTALALHGAILMVATYQFTPDGALRLPLPNIYGAILALLISAGSLSRASLRHRSAR